MCSRLKKLLSFTKLQISNGPNNKCISVVYTHILIQFINNKIMNPNLYTIQLLASNHYVVDESLDAKLSISSFSSSGKTANAICDARVFNRSV